MKISFQSIMAFIILFSLALKAQENGYDKLLLTKEAYEEYKNKGIVIASPFNPDSSPSQRIPKDEGNLRYYGEVRISKCLDWDVSDAGYAPDNIKKGEGYPNALYLGKRGSYVILEMGFHPDFSFYRVKGCTGIPSDILTYISVERSQDGSSWKTWEKFQEIALSEVRYLKFTAESSLYLRLRDISLCLWGPQSPGGVVPFWKPEDGSSIKDDKSHPSLTKPPPHFTFDQNYYNSALQQGIVISSAFSPEVPASDRIIMASSDGMWNYGEAKPIRCVDWNISGPPNLRYIFPMVSKGELIWSKERSTIPSFLLPNKDDFVIVEMGNHHEFEKCKIKELNINVYLENGEISIYSGRNKGDWFLLCKIISSGKQNVDLGSSQTLGDTRYLKLVTSNEAYIWLRDLSISFYGEPKDLSKTEVAQVKEEPESKKLSSNIKNGENGTQEASRTGTQEASKTETQREKQEIPSTSPEGREKPSTPASTTTEGKKTPSTPASTTTEGKETPSTPASTTTEGKETPLTADTPPIIENFVWLQEQGSVMADIKDNDTPLRELKIFFNLGPFQWNPDSGKFKAIVNPALFEIGENVPAIIAVEDVSKNRVTKRLDLGKKDNTPPGVTMKYDETGHILTGSIEDSESPIQIEKSKLYMNGISVSSFKTQKQTLMLYNVSYQLPQDALEGEYQAILEGYDYPGNRGEGSVSFKHIVPPVFLSLSENPMYWKDRKGPLILCKVWDHNLKSLKVRIEIDGKPVNSGINFNQETGFISYTPDPNEKIQPGYHIFSVIAEDIFQAASKKDIQIEVPTPVRDRKIALGRLIVVDVEGNGDGVANQEETIHLQVFLRNQGKDTIDGLDALLQSSSRYIKSIPENKTVYGRIEPGREDTASQAFKIVTQSDIFSNEDKDEVKARMSLVLKTVDYQQVLNFDLSIYRASSSYYYPTVTFYSMPSTVTSSSSSSSSSRGLFGGSSSVKINARFTNEGRGVAPLSLEVWINGKKMSSSNMSGSSGMKLSDPNAASGYITGSVYLSKGLNTILLRVTNRFGRIGEATANVTLTEGGGSGPSPSYPTVTLGPGGTFPSPPFSNAGSWLWFPPSASTGAGHTDFVSQPLASYTHPSFDLDPTGFFPVFVGDIFAVKNATDTSFAKFRVLNINGSGANWQITLQYMLSTDGTFPLFSGR